LKHSGRNQHGKAREDRHVPRTIPVSWYISLGDGRWTLATLYTLLRRPNFPSVKSWSAFPSATPLRARCAPSGTKN